MQHALIFTIKNRLAMAFRISTPLVLVIMLSGCQPPKQESRNIITSDITHFWQAYDQIRSTTDSALQHKYLDSIYFQRGTAGLAAIRRARNYTAQDYLHAINHYPAFWSSVRENTLRSDLLGAELEEGIEKLRTIYPPLRPAKIYFTIGALRTNGTTQDSLVLIGSELAMADENTVSSEFPEEERADRKAFFDSNPIDDLVLLNVHEYVHTQQNPIVHNLLSYAIYEGVAEFVSTKALGVPSASPAIAFGKKNAEAVRARFEHEMFYTNNYPKWLWSSAPNDFGIRDLGYYIGYQMCENYYERAKDKKAAIKQLIELDYANEEEIEAFVEATGFFSKPLDELYREFEAKRPFVTGIKPFENQEKGVSPKIKEITIEFSAPLNGYNTGVDFGDLGKAAFPKNDVNKRYWSEDRTSWTLTVDLEPLKKYQIFITNNFRTEDDIPLRPYLIEFETGNE